MDELWPRYEKLLGLLRKLGEPMLEPSAENPPVQVEWHKRRMAFEAAYDNFPAANAAPSLD
jgi:hypothetical protein